MTILTFDFYIHCFVDLCGYVDSDVGWMECDEGYAGVLLGWSCACVRLGLVKREHSYRRRLFNRGPPWYNSRPLPKAKENTMKSVSEGTA